MRADQYMGGWALALAVGGCSLSPLDPAPDASTAPEIAQTADVTDSSSEPETSADAASGCDPACPPWQACASGSCGSKKCALDSECRGPEEASNPKHFCYKGQCAAFQCAIDSECKAEERCNTFTYLCEPRTTGCTSVADCDDNNSCTTDYCDEFGECSNKLKPGCCAVNSDCNDGSACTTDSCAGGACQFSPLANCCSSDLDCDDAKPCTSEMCVGGSCQYKKVANCCATDIECDDAQDWSTDICHQTKCLHSLQASAVSCTTAADCTTNSCVTAECLAGKCSWYPSGSLSAGCCKTDTQCVKDVACQIDSCTALQCKSVAATGISGHIWHRFDNFFANQWTFKGSSSSVQFHLTALAKIAGASSLRYGVPDKVSFEDSTANKGEALSPVFTVPQSAGLQFWVMLDASPGAAIHLAGLDVLDAGGATLQAGLWSKTVDLNTGTTSGKWVQVQKSLAAWAGKQVRLRIWFDQVKYDTSNKNKLGLVVDELVITGACP